MDVGVLKPQSVEQAAAGRLAKVENLIEAAGAPVVRIGDFCVPGCVGIKASKKVNFSARLSVGGQCVQRLLVVAVHGQHPVKLLKIGDNKLP